jgi:hypothetical protein
MPKGGSQRPMVIVTVPFETTWANNPSVIAHKTTSAGIAMSG